MAAVVSGKCPRCHEGTIFRQVLMFRDRCPVCDLDLDQFNVGDGATVFLILILNIVGMVGILLSHFVVGIPFWLNFPLWIVIIAGLGLLGLRVAKALLLALEYKNDARLGSLKR